MLVELETQCPKCDFKLLQQSTGLNIDGQFVCPDCGHCAELAQFLTPASKDRVMEAAKQAAIKALSNIPGFKN